MPLRSCPFSKLLPFVLATAVLAALVVDALSAQPPSQPASEAEREACIRRLAETLAPRLARARYMEANPEPVTVPGWEGYPTIKYTYSVKDRATGVNKTAQVIMLNPDARQLARWIVTACLEAKGSLADRYTDKLVKRIMGQSGAQFPVRGIVYEDILPANGVHEVYCFMDGVTVKINGVDHRSEQQPSPAQLARALAAGRADVNWVGVYARIQSTTREEYRAAGGKEDTAGGAWLEVSRKLYQDAWGKDRNEMMIAWAKAGL